MGDTEWSSLCWDYRHALLQPRGLESKPRISYTLSKHTLNWTTCLIPNNLFQANKGNFTSFTSQNLTWENYRGSGCWGWAKKEEVQRVETDRQEALILEMNVWLVLRDQMMMGSWGHLHIKITGGRWLLPPLPPSLPPQSLLSTPMQVPLWELLWLQDSGIWR